MAYTIYYKRNTPSLEKKSKGTFQGNILPKKG